MSHLLSATILLFAVWPVYYLLLRYSDRYVLNRLFLLLVMVAVVTLPFIEFSSPAPVVTQSIQGSISYLELGVNTGGASIDPIPKEIRHGEEGEEIHIANRTGVTFFFLPKVYYFGLGLMTLILGFRLLFILGLHLRSRLNKDRNYRLLHRKAKPGQAFTFGRNLYFSSDVPDGPDFDHILNHERIHARQLHSIDILLSEIFLCIFWFHPAAWWLRTSMRANLEYLVDQAVISNGADRRDYQLALVRQSQGSYGLALALPFSEPSLKSRIVRMTGMPEYRIVALAAAMVLVFWLGVSLLVINGNSFEDEPQGREYLEAAAHPGDPYYKYYQNNLPEELTSLEVYTNRMVTVSEYLQLRAILSKVPGAKLYVYKNSADEGYSLELRHGKQENGAIHELGKTPSNRYISMIGIEKVGDYLPAAMRIDVKHDPLKGVLSPLVYEMTTFQPDYTPNFSQLTPEGLGDDLLVFINRRKIDLIKHPILESRLIGDAKRLNGIDISAFGAADWPKVLVEGRTQPAPLKRMEKLLNVKTGATRSFSLVSAGSVEGTYRDWYDSLGFLKDQPVFAYYNDRPVTVDFLLDTEFGDNAMIQHGVIYDTPMGRYALQVLDDYADVTGVLNRVMNPMEKRTLQGNVTKAIDFAALYDGKEVELDLFFKRLPMPAEVEQLNVYLEQILKERIRVFQDCTFPEGDYTLELGREDKRFFGFDGWPAGSRQENPVRLQVVRTGSGGAGKAVFRPMPLPPGAPNADVLLRINGAWVAVHTASVVPYKAALLDDGPLKVKMKCLLGLSSENKKDYNIWTASRILTQSFFSKTMVGDEVRNIISSQELEGIPIRFFIENGEATADDFTNQPVRNGMKLSLAARTNGPTDQVVVRLDY